MSQRFHKQLPWAAAVAAVTHHTSFVRKAICFRIDGTNQKMFFMWGSMYSKPPFGDCAIYSETTVAGPSTWAAPQGTRRRAPLRRRCLGRALDRSAPLCFCSVERIGCSVARRRQTGEGSRDLQVGEKSEGCEGLAFFSLHSAGLWASVSAIQLVC